MRRRFEFASSNYVDDFDQRSRLTGRYDEDYSWLYCSFRMSWLSEKTSHKLPVMQQNGKKLIDISMITIDTMTAEPNCPALDRISIFIYNLFNSHTAWSSACCTRLVLHSPLRGTSKLIFSHRMLGLPICICTVNAFPKFCRGHNTFPIHS